MQFLRTVSKNSPFIFLNFRIFLCEVKAPLLHESDSLKITMPQSYLLIYQPRQDIVYRKASKLSSIDTFLIGPKLLC